MTHTRRFSRRAALLLPLLLLSGCGWWDDWFGDNKARLPGTRIAVMAVNDSLAVGPNPRKVTLPTPTPNADWPQSGGVASHDMGHPALRDQLATAWTADIGTGGGFRRKITAQPIVAGGHVFTMDSDAVINSFDAATGRRAWTFDTESDDERNINVGGGIAIDAATLYAATGRGDLIALDAATGKVLWRTNLGTAARSAPTIADGRLFVPTIDNRLLAMSTTDGHRIWTYQAATAATLVLGLPAPAYADGLVVAGFGSGDLAALRAATGAVAWGDSLASARGRNSLADFSAIRGRPVIKDGQVYAIGIGGLLVATDLRSGRRLWERDVASYETPWVAGDWIFVLSADSRVAAIARDDGSVAWVTQLDPFENMEKQKDPIRWVGPVLAGDRLVVAGTNDVALALSPYTGAILGRQTLPGAASLAPTVAGGTLYILTDDATLTALR